MPQRLRNDFRKENYHNKLVYIQDEFIENQNGLNFNSNFEGGNLLKGKDNQIDHSDQSDDLADNRCTGH